MLLLLSFLFCRSSCCKLNCEIGSTKSSVVGRRPASVICFFGFLPSCFPPLFFSFSCRVRGSFVVVGAVRTPSVGAVRNILVG